MVQQLGPYVVVRAEGTARGHDHALLTEAVRKLEAAEPVGPQPDEVRLGVGRLHRQPLERVKNPPPPPTAARLPPPALRTPDLKRLAAPKLGKGVPAQNRAD